jgi:Aspartyl/Asparaginyl beta-hydroxylase
VPGSAKLLFTLDPAGLQADLAQIRSELWVPHFNKDYFNGEWSGVALRSNGGLPDRLYSDPKAQSVIEDTPLLERCPNIRAVLGNLKCPLKSVRFLKLAAGSTIDEHRDYDLGYELAEVRLHIPIVTNPDVIFYVDARRVEMKEGECWYLDLGLPHWVENRGQSDRIHLVIDCELNEWLSELILAGDKDQTNESQLITGIQSAPDEFERFREIVLTDPSLQQRLRQTADRESFIRLAVSTGVDVGCHFSTADVENAMESARRAWYEKWIP